MISSGKRSELAVSKEKIKKYPYISQSKKSEKSFISTKKKILKKRPFRFPKKTLSWARWSVLAHSVWLMIKNIKHTRKSIFCIHLKTKISKKVNLKQIEQSGSPKITHGKVIVTLQTKRYLKDYLKNPLNKK